MLTSKLFMALIVTLQVMCSVGYGICKGVAAGVHHSCGVRGGDGHAVCWGRSEGDWYGETIPPSPREQVNFMNAGGWFSMAIRTSDEKALCVLSCAWRRGHYHASPASLI